MPNITIANLNPCIDWQYNVSSFAHGGLNRVRRTYASAASKGTNVAVVLKNLGQAPHCVGFNFTDGGDKVVEKFDSLGIEHDLIMIPGAVRVNIKLYEETTGVMTELNQQGAFVSTEYVCQLEEKIRNLSNMADADDILVLAGSLPTGVDAGFYAKLAGIWQGRVFVDVDGDALSLALDEKPYCIKPNIHELERTFGADGKLQSPQDVVDFCRNTLNPAPAIVCVSMGAEGAVLVTPNETYFAPAIPVQVRGVQGAGDSMVAGLVHAAAMGKSNADALRYAMAAAAGSVMLDGTELCQRADFDMLLANYHLPLWFE